MNKFSKRHYEAVAVLLADKINQTRARGTKYEIEHLPHDLAYIEDFAQLFKSDSSKFDGGRFVDRINKLSNSNILGNYPLTK